MDPTALVTFLFPAPSPSVRQVELLGSWDNFSKPYRMSQDRRRGTGFWTGCFKFENIIFDGDGPRWMTRPRSGGLKQGGVYWYYYRIDGDAETYHAGLPHTADCPLMPSQVLNVIEVPIEIVAPVSRCRSASADAAGMSATTWAGSSPTMTAHTLDPEDKFAALDPPPVCRVHGRCISDLALGGRLESKPVSPSRSILSRASSRHARREVEDQQPCKRLRSSAYSSDYSGSSRCSSSYARSVIIAEACAEEGNAVDQSSAKAVTAPSTRPAPAVQPPEVNHFQDFDFGFAKANGLISQHHDVSSKTDDNLDEEFSSEVKQDPNPPDAHVEFLQPWHTRMLDSTNHDDLPEDTPSPATDQDQAALDLCSPTFSAATVSSHDGLNTPFRLSLGCSPAWASNDDGSDNALEGVAEKLQSFEIDSPDPRPPLLAGYILPAEPLSPTIESRFGKISSSPNDHSLREPASPDFLTASTGSMADDIFAELGYLGGSIA